MKNALSILLVGLVVLLAACTREEPRVWVNGWQETSQINDGRAGPAVAEHNGYIYLVGGIDGKKFLKTTEYARIQPDGTLGPWQYGPELNEERAWLEGVVYNGYLYVAGGANSKGEPGVYAGNLLASVERAKINPDGSLAPWELQKTSMAMPRRCNKVVLWNDQIYSVGGYAVVMLDNVERATIQKDGTVGEWKMEPLTMALPRYVNGVKVKKDMMYAFAGHAHKNGVGLTSVEWTKIGPDGELLGWKETSPLNAGRHGLASAAHGGYFYAVGGFTGVKFIDSVEKSKVGPDGELSAWEYTTPLRRDRMNYGIIVYKDWIYTIAGTNAEGYIKTVDYATFDANGDIGFKGTKEEKAAYEKMMEERKQAKVEAESAKKDLPYAATVKEVLRTQGYSYIRVTLKEGDAWLAVSDPTVDVKAGDVVKFGSGLFMPNFYSKELKRNFKTLFFMDAVQKTENRG